MEQTPLQQLKTGFFVIAGLVMIMASILFIGGDKALFTSYMHLSADFSQVQGLSNGSVVSLSGVTVGNIDQIEFVPENGKLRVTMQVDERYQNQIPKDSKVEIRTQGALGDKYIFIIPGDFTSGKIEDMAQLQALESPDLFGIISSRGSETEKIFDIINEVYKITKTINQDGQLQMMMKNFSVASESLKTASGDIQSLSAEMREGKLTKNANEAVQTLNKLMTKIDQGQGTLGLLINDRSLHEQLKKLTGESDQKEHIRNSIRSTIRN